jgi:hypothetical protein
LVNKIHTHIHIENKQCICFVWFSLDWQVQLELSTCMLEFVQRQMCVFSLWFGSGSGSVRLYIYNCCPVTWMCAIIVESISNFNNIFIAQIYTQVHKWTNSNNFCLPYNPIHVLMWISKSQFDFECQCGCAVRVRIRIELWPTKLKWQQLDTELTVIYIFRSSLFVCFCLAFEFDSTWC